MTDSHHRAASGINHVAIVTAELDRLVAFYCDVLGGTPADVPVQPGAERAKLIRFGPRSAVALLEVAASPCADGRGDELARGHIDHVGFDVATEQDLEAIRRRLVEYGASQGELNDYGSLVTVSFTDPDGMSTEVCWLRDPSLQNLHPPLRGLDHRGRSWS